MPAALIPAAITAAGSLGGAAIQASSANSASQAAQNAVNQQLAFQQGVYNQAQTNLNPYANAGNAANSALSGLLGTGGNPAAQQAAFQNFLNSTNYKFTQQQGLQGIQYANAPAFSSGATAKALDTFNTGLAGNAITGYEGMLQNQAGLGVQAASALNNVGVGIGQLGNQASQYGANAQGQAAYATGNAYTNALQGLVKSAGTASSYGDSGNPGTFGYTINPSTGIDTTGWGAGPQI